jgi:hypothetical protein
MSAQTSRLLDLRVATDAMVRVATMSGGFEQICRYKPRAQCQQQAFGIVTGVCRRATLITWPGGGATVVLRRLLDTVLCLEAHPQPGGGEFASFGAYEEPRSLALSQSA